MNELNLESNSGGKSEWYAVYTRHQHEKTVFERFSRMELEAFLPTYRVARQWKDRIKHLSLPLFPCYVFLRGGLERRLDVLSTPGVHSLVSFAGRPAAIPEIQVEAIRRVIEAQLPVEPHPFLRCGDWVRVTSGPLAGINGILIRKKSSFRLILSAELLGKSIAVEVNAFSVEPLPHQATVKPPELARTYPSVHGRLQETGGLAGDQTLEEQLR
jgi:transcription antitermination factor NusG